MDLDMEKFSYRLIVLMEEFNMTQIQLAKQIGTSNVTISRYLNCERLPRLDVITRIASVFNVSVDYLLGINDNKELSDINGNIDADIAILAKNLFSLSGNNHLSKSQIEFIKNLLLVNKNIILSAENKIKSDKNEDVS